MQNAISRSMKRFLLRFLIIGTIIVCVLNGIFMLMTWLTSHVININNRFIESETEYLGTLIIALILIMIIFIINYRKRKKELVTLSEHIRRVASGDFSTQITYKKNDSMAHIYQDLNKMSAELSSVQFLRKDFINNFSHEFKTPIASIHGFASLMLEKEIPREQAVTYLTIIKDESDRLSRLTSNTILLSKLSSQEIISETEEFDLGEQLRQCSIILSHEWLAKEQIFSGDFPKISYVGNRELMQHLWLNLIGNAIRYTPRGGEITVTLSQEEGHTVVNVADTGIGMDWETIQHLFEPYYQADSSHHSSGMGLGLSICHQIVNMCEGNIQVKSIPGEGSTFTVTLP